MQTPSAHATSDQRTGPSLDSGPERDARVTAAVHDSPASIEEGIRTTDWGPILECCDLAQAREMLKWCDSYGRLPKLLEIECMMDGDEWLTVLGEEWEHCDNVSQHADELVAETPLGRTLLDGRGRERLMTPEENAAWRALPDEVEVWRGCHGDNKWGLCWTLDETVAKKFPNYRRFRREGRRPLLVKALARKDDIAAVKLDRQESAVIAWRPRAISITTID